METGDEIKINASKIKNWFKDPHNIYFFIIIALAIIIRLYYFKLTYNQPIWWDEGEYMNMAKAMAFNRDYIFLPVRPIFFSLISAIFFKISNTEFLPRVLMLILSILSVYAVYLLGKETYGKKAGLLASLFMSIFYLNLFFTYRFLVDLPSLTFFTLSAFFFYRYFRDNNKKMLYYGAVIIGIGTLFRLTTATFLFAAALFVLITEQFKFIKKKEVWIAALIFILILTPYIIWGYGQFNGFVITLAGKYNAPAEGTFLPNGIANLKSYLSLFPNYLSWPFLIIFIFGLLLMYKLILAFDLLLKGEKLSLKRDLYIFLLFLIPILAASFSIGSAHIENRYIINAFPAIFIIASVAILSLYSIISKHSKAFAVILLITFIVFTMNYQYKSADSLIKSKINSFSDFKAAGLWLKENTLPNEKIIVSGSPMVTYYSDRYSRGFTDTEEEFEKLLIEDPDFKYFIISMIQPSPEWTYSYPQKKNLTPAQIYFPPGNQQNPILIIYKL